jgi:hypothetical protein
LVLFGVLYLALIGAGEGAVFTLHNIFPADSFACDGVIDSWGSRRSRFGLDVINLNRMTRIIEFNPFMEGCKAR